MVDEENAWQIPPHNSSQEVLRMPNRESLQWFMRLSVKIGTLALCGAASETFGMGAGQVSTGIPVLLA